MVERLRVSIEQRRVGPHRKRICGLCRTNRQGHSCSSYEDILFALPSFELKITFERTKLPCLLLNPHDHRCCPVSRVSKNVSRKETIQPLLPIPIAVVP